MSYLEYPVVFNCEGDRLIGVIATPIDHLLETGVLIVVGGPQYRAGSHRQFTLLARDLADAGIASLRFDYRGMGDSEGAVSAFDTLDNDISVAITTLFAQVPELRSLVVWGLCDAASAALIYAHCDPRVTGLILLNPWVHNDVAAARVRLTYYYWRRLIQPSLWLKLFSGRFGFLASLRDLLASVRLTVTPVDAETTTAESLVSTSRVPAVAPNFVGRMLHGLRRFRGNSLLILSGNDLTAHEFQLLIERNHQWKAVCTEPRFHRHTIQQANHTFASHGWRSEVASLTIAFVRNGGYK